MGPKRLVLKTVETVRSWLSLAFLDVSIVNVWITKKSIKLGFNFN